MHKRNLRMFTLMHQNCIQHLHIDVKLCISWHLSIYNILFLKVWAVLTVVTNIPVLIPFRLHTQICIYRKKERKKKKKRETIYSNGICNELISSSSPKFVDLINSSSVRSNHNKAQFLLLWNEINQIKNNYYNNAVNKIKKKLVEI